MPSRVIIARSNETIYGEIRKLTMHQRRLPAVAALLTAATLTLTACAGGDSSSDEIPGADQASKSTSPSPSHPSGPDTAQADVNFKLPKDVKVDIEADKTGDKQKDAILSDHAEILAARQNLFVDLDPKSPLIDRYFADDIQSTISKQVEAAKSEHRTVTGTVRYYNRRVTSHKSDLAQVTYCEDQSKFYDKDTKTGKINKTQANSDSYVLYTATLEKGLVGNWRVLSFNGDRGSSECM